MQLVNICERRSALLQNVLGRGNMEIVTQCQKGKVAITIRFNFFFCCPSPPQKKDKKNNVCFSCPEKETDKNVESLTARAIRGSCSFHLHLQFSFILLKSRTFEKALRSILWIVAQAQEMTHRFSFVTMSFEVYTFITLGMAKLRMPVPEICRKCGFFYAPLALSFPKTLARYQDSQIFVRFRGTGLSLTAQKQRSLFDKYHHLESFSQLLGIRTNGQLNVFGSFVSEAITDLN